MKLKDVGERTLLELTRNICEKGPYVKVGVGDDGAVLEIGENLLVITTDMLISNVHFTLDTPSAQIGKKAVVVNLSDIAAMGADPIGLVYSVGTPANLEVEFVSDLLKSMNSTARKYGSSLVGGDLNEAEEIIVSGTAFGITTQERLLLRSGAEKGDIIGITGELGAATAAVKATLENIDFENKKDLKIALQEPTARVEEGKILSKSGKVTSAIDVTDGLAANLWQISKESDVGLTIEHGKLPINKDAKKLVREEGFDLDEIILYGGEDFELLFTVKPNGWKELKKKFEEIGTRISKIGRVKGNEGVTIRRNGKLEDLPDRGYEHFRK